VSSLKKEGLSSKERLTLNKDFKRVFKEGKKIWVGRHLLIIYCPNQLGLRRLGLVVSGKIGKAVERNKVKRLLRELFRKNKELFPEGVDLIMIPHPNLKNLSYGELLELVRKNLSSGRNRNLNAEKTFA
jgi:ribonuclease P protein component